MRRFRSVPAAAGIVVLLAASACTSGNPPSTSPAATAQATSAATVAPPATASPATASPATQASPAAPIPTDSVAEAFPRDKFSDPTTIDSKWLPLIPGTQFVWDGKILVDDERLGHRVIATVTDLSKVVDGVRTVVVLEQDFTPPNVRAEAELSFYAQDDDGNVWLIGEYPEEYEDGKLADAPTWMSGIDGARAGLVVQADPKLGEPSYSEGWAPSVGFADRARVFETHSKTCVRVGCHDDVLVIDEFNPDEPDAHQFKYYAPGVGVVRVGWAGALEDTQETLELTRVATLDPEAIAKVRATALALEKSAYQVSPKMYGQTAPAVPAP